MKKAVILLTGGLDSATCLAIVKKKNFLCYALSLEFGQKHNVELIAAKNIASYFNVVQHEVIKLPIGNFGGFTLTDDSIDVPEQEIKRFL